MLGVTVGYALANDARWNGTETAVQDALDAVAHVRRAHPELGALVLAGESAGAAVALAAAHALAARGAPVAATVCSWPLTTLDARFYAPWWARARGAKTSPASVAAAPTPRAARGAEGVGGPQAQIARALTDLGVFGRARRGWLSARARYRPRADFVAADPLPPTLLLCAERDRVTPLGQQRMFADACAARACASPSSRAPTTARAASTARRAARSSCVPAPPRRRRRRGGARDGRRPRPDGGPPRRAAPPVAVLRAAPRRPAAARRGGDGAARAPAVARPKPPRALFRVRAFSGDEGPSATDATSSNLYSTFGAAAILTRLSAIQTWNFPALNGPTTIEDVKTTLNDDDLHALGDAAILLLQKFVERKMMNEAVPLLESLTVKPLYHVGTHAGWPRNVHGHDYSGLRSIVKASLIDGPPSTGGRAGDDGGRRRRFKRPPKNGAGGHGCRNRHPRGHVEMPLARSRREERSVWINYFSLSLGWPPSSRLVRANDLPEYDFMQGRGYLEAISSCGSRARMSRDTRGGAAIYMYGLRLYITRMACLNVNFVEHTWQTKNRTRDHQTIQRRHNAALDCRGGHGCFARHGPIAPPC